MELHAYIEANQERLVRSLQEMVRIPTVNPPGREYLPMVEWLKKACRALGMKTEVHRVSDEEVAAAEVDPSWPRYNLIARLDCGAKETVHFNAHYDVVPVSGAWKGGDPFSGQVRGNWLYGRGSGDMKGSIASLLMALEGVLRMGGPVFNVEFSFSADEETGGALGAGYIVKHGLVQADYAVVCEGASGARLGCGHNGVLWFEVEVEGKAAHASNPDAGVNAFEKAADLVRYLQPLKKTLAQVSRRYCDFNGQERNPTINIGGVVGGGEGDKINTVPSRLVFSVDRRVVPDESLRAAETEFRRSLERAAASGGVRYKVRSLLSIAPCITAPESRLAQSFSTAMRVVRRRGVEYRATAGFTDLHFFVEEGGMQGVGYGVAGEQAHGVDERVAVRDLVQTARTYAEFMRRGV
jgi:succinyl-diaminopimelate desuccinylase